MAWYGPCPSSYTPFLRVSKLSYLIFVLTVFKIQCKFIYIFYIFINVFMEKGKKRGGHGPCSSSYTPYLSIFKLEKYGSKSINYSTCVVLMMLLLCVSYTSGKK